MPFLGPGREAATQMIVSILGAMTAIKVGEMVYREPELSMTIAAGAGRYPIRALDHFFNPFSSTHRTLLATENDEGNYIDITVSGTTPDAQNAPHTVTANHPIGNTT